MRHTIKSLILAKQRPDAPGDVEKRIARRAASEQAHAETLEKFGTITPENAMEAINFQAKRIAELAP